MAHFAVLDENNIVTRVIVIHNNEAPDEATGIAFMTSLYGPGKYVQTSYNGRFRANYAGVGFAYDLLNDVFIEPRPYPSWLLDTIKWKWVSQVPYPTDGRNYRWDEPTLSWVVVL